VAFALQRLYGKDEAVAAHVRLLRSARPDEREAARRDVRERLMRLLAG
jgi:hypothetical protein